MAVDNSADDAPIIGHDRVCAVIAGLLRAAQARGLSDHALESMTGLSARRIKSYRVENKEPSLSAALSLALALGPDALNAVLALVGYAARPLDDPDDAAPGLIVAELIDATAVVARAAADGRFDHTERSDVSKARARIVSAAMALPENE